MPVIDDGPSGLGPSRAARPVLRLDAAAHDFYADLRLPPLLRQLLLQSSRLLDATAGSISLIDSARDTYAKMAEHGADCQLGQRFSLGEGVTGQVAARRRPVVLSRYSDVPAGHLPSTHPASSGGVAAVPIWWRGDVIGANVVFAGRRRQFTAGEVDELEVLTQVAAAGIVKAGASDPSLAHLLREHPRPDEESDHVRTTVTETGAVRPISPTITQAAVAIVTLAKREAVRHAPTQLHVAVVYQPDGLRLLVQDASANPAARGPADPLGTGAHSWRELAATAGGEASVEQVPGWGTLVRARFPYVAPSAPPEPLVSPSPLTPREREVLGLLAQGRSDREIATALMISPKTAEKHVGAVLRKTGTTSRTAAVVRCLERGWLSSAGLPRQP